VTDDAHTRGTDEPESGAEGVGDDGEGNGDDEQSSVELRSGGAEVANLDIATLEFTDTKHATNNEENVEGQEPVCEQSVDAQHDEEDGIVAGEIAKVVVDAVLDLAKVLGLGDLLEVEELGDRLQVGEAGADGLRADTVKATLQIEARCDGIDGKVDRHLDGVGEVGRESKLVESTRLIRVSS
jgi:hypothetical protein